MPGKQYYNTEEDLIKEVKTDLGNALAKTGGKKPQILVIGALGRCGGGALDLCKAVGIPESNLLKWDMAETAKGGPFREIRESDIFVNCIYLSADNIPKFVTEDFLREGQRQLSVVCDVSCDTTNPLNPIPFCNKPTYFDRPTITLPESQFSNPPLSYITIDHLPSLLPREASEAFSAALLPSLLELQDRENAKVWYVYIHTLFFRVQTNVRVAINARLQKALHIVSNSRTAQCFTWGNDADSKNFVGRKLVSFSRIKWPRCPRSFGKPRAS